MKIRTEAQIKMFDEAIMSCGGSVVLIDSRSEKEYDLKIPAEKAEAFARLPYDYRESLELFVTLREDTEVMIGFMDWLNRGGGHEDKTAAKGNAA